MIEIVTAAGVSLDLVPGQTIMYSVENAMLDSDRIPVGATTDIELAMSPKNKQIFGFTNVMAFVPKVKKIAASLVISGIPLISGALEFSSFSDGVMKFSLTTEDFENALQGQLYTLDLGEYASFMSAAREGTHEAIALPIIVNKSYAAKYELPLTTNDESVGVKVEVDWLTKYYNYPLTSEEEIDEKIGLLNNRVQVCKTRNNMLPAIKLPFLIDKIFGTGKYTIDDDIISMIEELAVVGTYITEKESTAPTATNEPLPPINLSSYLPKMSCVDFIKNLLNMFCATLFYDKGKYKIVANKNALTDSTFNEWTEKVDDDYSVEIEPKHNYEVSFGSKISTKQDEDEGTTSKDETTADISVDDVSSLMSTILTLDEYQTIENNINDNVYSAKSVTIPQGDVSPLPPNVRIMNIAVVQQGGMKDHNTNIDENAETTSCKCDFIVPTIIPLEIFLQRWMKGEVGAGRWRIFKSVCSMCPVISIPEIGGTRPDDVYIGLLRNNQLIDKGEYFVGQNWVDGNDRPNLPSIVHISNDITTEAMYNRYHTEFGAWLGRDRAVIRSKVKLSLNDIATLQMWRKIMLYNQLFFIKKLEVTFSTATEQFSCEAEFIQA